MVIDILAWLRGGLGGLLIGGAAAMMLLGIGRIAGISGLLARAAGLSKGTPWPLAAAFVLGMPVAGLALRGLDRMPELQGIGPHHPLSWALPIAGFLVGLGTRLGSGCTSGHGVCGLSRLSPRSMLAVASFMTAGFITATLLHGGQG